MEDRAFHIYIHTAEDHYVNFTYKCISENN